MRARLIFAAALLTASHAWAIQTSPDEAVEKARKLIDAGNHELALSVLAEAAPAIATIEDAEKRDSVAAGMHFFSALAHHRLGHKEKAEAELVRFFAISPSATALDPTKYEASFIKLFTSIRRSEVGRREGSPFDRLYPRYAGEVAPLKLLEWGASAEMQYLGNEADRAAFSRLRTDAERRAFVEQFWEKRDPIPATPMNELREVFHDRVAFADHAFRVGFLRGSLTDRGKVYVLLGRPKNAWVKPLTRAEGASIPMASGKYAEGVVERWVYRDEQLPRGVPRREIEFKFITEEGYGIGIMQREFHAMKALAEAAKTPMYQR